MARIFSSITFPITTQAPYVRGIWTQKRISMFVLLALIAPLGMAFFEDGITLVPTLALALVLTLFWNIIFARLRLQTLTLDWAVSAISFALIAPPALPLWQVGLGVSFGIVVGEQIFGGRGWNFLSPAVVALAFLAFSFPDTQQIYRSDLFALAIIPGAILLLVAGLISWRILIGAALGLGAIIWFAGYPDPSVKIMMGPLAFGLVFFACDPVSAASTNSGRWVYGLLSGLLIGLFGLPDGTFGTPTTLIFAILLASIFAPLIDYFVIAINAIRKRRRHV